MTTLRYKDFQGSVEFEDDTLVVTILHIEDLITATCERASEAQAVFEELVEDYLETCAAVGKEPCKPFKGSFNVRVSPALHRAAAIAAREAGQTLNGWVAGAIEQRLDTGKKPSVERTFSASLQA